MFENDQSFNMFDPGYRLIDSPKSIPSLTLFLLVVSNIGGATLRSFSRRISF
jgi:hypothetical protein